MAVEDAQHLHKFRRESGRITARKTLLQVQVRTPVQFWPREESQSGTRELVFRLGDHCASPDNLRKTSAIIAEQVPAHHLARVVTDLDGRGYRMDATIEGVLPMLLVEVSRNPQATEAHPHRLRPHRRRMVGDDRSHVGFFAAATRAGRDPLVPSPLPFVKESHARRGRLPFPVPVRSRSGVSIFGVQHVPVAPVRLFVHLGGPVLTGSVRHKSRPSPKGTVPVARLPFTHVRRRASESLGLN
jgi:hypothetical protein